jgi:hypothetical protein
MKMEGVKMLVLIMCLLSFNFSAEAKSARTVLLSDGDMEQVFVEPGFSTLLKFSSHPEPGLIGDQDGFKVEYMKNIVAIKPLISKGKTNLFVFTKEGQFNFQLVSSKGRHDNIVYVESRQGLGPPGPSALKTAVIIDDLLTLKFNRTVVAGQIKLTLDSIATPQSKSTIVLRVSVLESVNNKIKPHQIDSKWFSIHQGNTSINIESIFLESKPHGSSLSMTTGLILVRAAGLKKNEPLKLTLSIPSTPTGQRATILQVLFSANFSRK